MSEVTKMGRLLTVILLILWAAWGLICLPFIALWMAIVSPWRRKLPKEQHE